MPEDSITLSVGEEEIDVVDASVEMTSDADADTGWSMPDRTYSGSFSFSLPSDPADRRALARVLDTSIISDSDGNFIGFADIDIDYPPEVEAWLDYHREDDSSTGNE